MREILLYVTNSLIKEANDKAKIISAICAAPIVLDHAGLLKDKSYTAYPGFSEKIKDGTYKDENIVVDKNIITGKGPAIAASLAFTLIGILLGKDKEEEIRKETLYNLL